MHEPLRLARTLFVAAALAALMALTACGSEPDPTATPTPSGPMLPATVTDVHGNDIVVEDVSRIVVMNGDVTEVVFALGLGDNIVAVDTGATYPEAALRLTKIGYQRRLSAEGVLSMEPTVIIGNENAGPPEALEQLRATGVPVVVLESVSAIDGAARKIRGVAQALGVPEKGEAIATKLEAEIEEVKALAEQAEERPTAVLLYMRGLDTLFLIGRDHLSHELFEASGAISGGVAGASLQGVFRNPLAEPGVIGASSGAAAGAVAAIVLGISIFGMTGIAVAAFASSLVATAVVYLVARTQGQTEVTTLILAGIAVNATAGAMTGLLTFIADDDQLRSITFWMLGSVGGATWPVVTSVAPLFILGLALLPFWASSLNLLNLADRETRHLGVSTERVHLSVIVLCALVTGAAISVAGIVGFVGLVVPHVIRLIAGPDHRFLLPARAYLAGPPRCCWRTCWPGRLWCRQNCRSARLRSWWAAPSSCGWCIARAGTGGACIDARIESEPRELRRGRQAVGQRGGRGVAPRRRGGGGGPQRRGQVHALRTLAGDLPPTEGDVEVCGRAMRDAKPAALARLRSMLSQHIPIRFPFTAREVVMMGRHPHIPRWRSPTETDYELADDAMRSAQVSHLAERVYPTLSGGEQRRVSLARVLTQNTPVVLLDEPTNALDIAHQQLVMRLCRRLADDGRAVLAVLHDLDLAGAYADRVMVLCEGRQVASGAPEEVLRPELLTEVFNQPVMVVPHPQTGKPVVLAAFE